MPRARRQLNCAGLTPAYHDSRTTWCDSPRTHPEDDQERRLKRLIWRIRFAEVLFRGLQAKAAADLIADHNKSHLLLYALGKLGSTVSLKSS